jgi:transcriptional regulator with XRE-family HTH domain
LTRRVNVARLVNMPGTRPLPDLLRELREQRGRSLRGTARDLGVDAGYLSRIERGHQSPSPGMLEKAASYYEVPAEELTLASGALPADIVAIIRENPGLVDELRSRYGRV